VNRTGVAIECNGLAPLEIASAVLFGRDDAVDPPPRSVGVGSVSALESSLMRALRRPPCLIAFSGGRDSSGLLAVATRAARREGLPDPVPVSALYRAVPETYEDEWQQLVVRHLGLTEWIRRQFTDETDAVGPIAVRLMQEHGLRYPYNLHLLKPMIDEAAGGSFVTGLGGDEALTPGSRALAVLTGTVRPRPRDVLTVAATVAPRFLRRAVLSRRGSLSFPWLRADANKSLGADWLDDELRLPLRWDLRLHEWSRSRYVQTSMRNIARIASERDVEVIHPFVDRAFVSALASAGGARGFRSRTAAMDALFGDVLPPSVRRRSTKASFDGVLWNRHARTFVGELEPGELGTALQRLGVEPIVDRHALAVHWATPSPLANSFLLLQACWLALHD